MKSKTSRIPTKNGNEKPQPPKIAESTPLLSGKNTAKPNQTLQNYKYSRTGWTEDLRNYVDENPEISLAAFLLRDAISEGGTETTAGTSSYFRKSRSAEGEVKDEVKDEVKMVRSKMSLTCRSILAKRWVHFLVMSAVYILVGLSFVEHPPWCEEIGCRDVLSMRGPVSFGEGGEDTGGIVRYYPNSGICFLNPNQSKVVECVCASLLLFHIILLVGRDGNLKRYFAKGTGKMAVRVVQFISVWSLIGGLIVSMFYTWRRPVAIYLRITIFVTFFKDIQRELRTVYDLMPELLNTLFILLMIIVFYAWIGVVAFYDSLEGVAHFPSLIEGMWTLWTSVTTGDYPQYPDTISGYSSSHLAGLYFITFIIIACIFMLNVILATVVNTYNRDIELFAEEKEKQVNDNLKKAFQLLDKQKTGKIEKKTMTAIFAVLNEDCPDIGYIPHQIADLLFALLDKDGSSCIAEQEFMEFGHVMLLEFDTAASYETFVERNFPNMFNSPRFQKIIELVKSEKFELTIDIILVLNAIVVFIQTFPELTGEDVGRSIETADGEVNTIWEVMETVFTVIYCIEMATKILVLGWKRYAEKMRNIFDATITILSLAATCYVYYPNTFNDSRLIRYVVMARVLRLTRILVAMEQFQVIGRTCMVVLPAASRIFWLMICIMYCFAALGMEVFGGRVTRDPSNPLSERLEGTAFADNQYWATNFNDMMSGMNLLFNLLLINNWSDQADGFLAVSGSKWSRLFFLVFNIFGTLVVINIVIAIIIDEFMREWEEYHERENEAEDTGGAILTDGGERALFDASNITGTATGLSGGYIARLKNRGAHLEMKDGLLRNLFTRTMAASSEQKES